ncbi:hypothetical protein GCM10022631_30370 [Deinococcus rubellus]|uniref:hypothetical protein n=1 Tax=Deinococcus rubellus TaxID=1889240 RepID=UPI0031E600FC
MGTFRQPVDAVMNTVRSLAPRFKRAHAFHVVAELYGLPNAQTLAACSDVQLLSRKVLPKMLASALGEYQISLSKEAAQDLLDRVAAFEWHRRKPVMLHKILTPWENWNGIHAVLLEDIIDQHQDRLSDRDLSDKVDFLSYLLEDPMTTARIFLERNRDAGYGSLSVLRAVTALLNKIKYPELEFPTTMLIKIHTVGGRGESKGQILASPIKEYAAGMDFEEVLLRIPRGFEHQETMDAFYVRDRGTQRPRLIRSRTVHAGTEDSIPIRHVNEKLTFNMSKL